MTQHSTQENVAKGMSITQEKIDKAKLERNYIKVGPKGGNLCLSGARTRWKTDEYKEDIYVPAFRLVGKEKDIRKALELASTEKPVINDAIAGAYTLNNHEHSVKFKQEIDEYKLNKKPVAKKEPTFSLEDLKYIHDNLGVCKSVPRSSAKSPRSPGKLAGKRGGGRVSDLARRLQGLASNKVLDASKMELSSGKKIVTASAPGKNSGKIGVPGLALVSSDAARYAAAVNLLKDHLESRGESTDQYIDAYNKLSAQGGVAPVKQSSPAKSVSAGRSRGESRARSVSPPRSLAPVSNTLAPVAGLPEVPSASNLPQVPGSVKPAVAPMGTRLGALPVRAARPPVGSPSPRGGSTRNGL